MIEQAADPRDDNIDGLAERRRAARVTPVDPKAFLRDRIAQALPSASGWTPAGAAPVLSRADIGTEMQACPRAGQPGPAFDEVVEAQAANWPLDATNRTSRTGLGLRIAA